MLDLQEIIKKHEQVLHGKKVLFVPKDGKELLIVMSAHNQGEKYLGLRSFLENQKYDLLFITDPKNTWYLDDNLGKTYQDIIGTFVNNYDPRYVSIFGSSMSGYGALYHGIHFDINVIASNPQVNLDISKDYSWEELRTHISEIKKYVNLENWIPENYKNTAIYLIHGQNILDVMNVKKLLSSKTDSMNMIIQKLNLDSHISYFGRNISYIYTIHEMLKTMRVDMYLDINNLEHESVPEKHKQNRDSLRKAKRNIINPHTDFDEEGNGILWHNRHDYEEIGTTVFFRNCGFYNEKDEFSGVLAYFNGMKWCLLDPLININQNLIQNGDFASWNNGIGPFSQNETFTSDFWWMRYVEKTEHSISKHENTLMAHVKSLGGNNAFINQSIKLNDALLEKIQNKYITLSADIKTSNGKVALTLGGYDQNGYHHINQFTTQNNMFENIVVTEQFTDTTKIDHKDGLFARITYLADKKEKNVYIKNVFMIPGFFPMGFKFA